MEIWFQDEARVGQQGTLTRIWAPRGSRPRALRDTRYTSAYIFGAVCPERAATAALVMPHADTAAMHGSALEFGERSSLGESFVIVSPHAPRPPACACSVLFLVSDRSRHPRRL